MSIEHVLFFFFTCLYPVLDKARRRVSTRGIWYCWRTMSTAGLDTDAV